MLLNSMLPIIRQFAALRRLDTLLPRLRSKNEGDCYAQQPTNPPLSTGTTLL
jgi:hypothetical protein